MFLPLLLIVLPITLSMVFAGLFRDPVWYGQLQKPASAPPTYVMSFMCTSLYILLGIAAPAVLCGTKDNVSWMIVALATIISLLFLPIFFGLHSLIGGALITTFSLIIGSILLFRFSFRHRSQLASTLMLIYILWLGFMTYYGWHLVGLNVQV